MKKRIAVLALVLAAAAGAARADMTLFASRESVTRAQALALSAELSRTLDTRVVLLGEEEAGQSFASMVYGGHAPDLAIVPAQQAAQLARAGFLLPLSGGEAAQALLDACTHEGTQYAVPLAAVERCMAVRVSLLEAVNMGHLLDTRAYPVWYPSQMMQALDELALSDVTGMSVWPPSEEDALWLMALLQGASGVDFADAAAGGYAAGQEELEEAFSWLGDMLGAGLISLSPDRDKALDAFLTGGSAIFADWTPAESRAHAQLISEGRIVLLPYPCATGTIRRAGQVLCLCAVRRQEEAHNALARRAAGVLSSSPAVRKILGGLPDAQDAPWLSVLAARPCGATFGALFCRAARDVMGGGSPAEAAGRVARVMEAAWAR